MPYVDMEFRRGDLQWLKSSVLLHRRAAYEDFAEPERRCHLLRLCLAAPEFEDGDALLRQGLDARLVPEHASTQAFGRRAASLPSDATPLGLTRASGDSIVIHR